MKIDFTKDEIKMLKIVLDEISIDVHDGMFFDEDDGKSTKVFDSLHKKVSDFVRGLHE